MMVAAECAPVAQAGGLGEVVFGLSRELELRGHSVEIVIPKYDCMRYDQIFGFSVTYEDLWVPWYSAFVHCTVRLPVASTFDVMVPEEPKFIPVADTAQFVATLAVQAVLPPLVLLPPVGQTALPR